MEEERRVKIGNEPITIRVVVDQPPGRQPQPPKSEEVVAYERGVFTTVLIVIMTLAARTIVEIVWHVFAR